MDLNVTIILTLIFNVFLGMFLQYNLLVRLLQDLYKLCVMVVCFYSGACQFLSLGQFSPLFSCLPVSRIDPAGLLGVVVDIKHFTIIIPRFFPAIR